MNAIEMLKVPFGPNAVRWRIGRKSNDKKKATALAYVDARDVMDRLDTSVGADGWEDEYTTEPPRSVRKQCKVSKEYYFEQVSGRVTCTLKIKIGDAWISKSDAAGETNVEGEKGAFSDAFKRAAVKFGLGRDLYGIESFYYPIDQYGNFKQPPELPEWYLNKYKTAIQKFINDEKERAA